MVWSDNNLTIIHIGYVGLLLAVEFDTGYLITNKLSVVD